METEGTAVMVLKESNVATRGAAEAYGVTAPVGGHRRLSFDPRTMRAERLRDVLANARIEVGEGNAQTFFARLLRMDRFTITHIRAAEGAVTWRPSPGIGENRFMFVFVAKGNLTVVADETRFAATEEAILVAFPGKGPITMSSTSPLEAMAFTFDASEVAPLTLTPNTVHMMHPSSSIFLASYHLLHALVFAGTPEEEEDSAALRSLLQGTARGLLRAAHVPTITLQESVRAIIAEQHTNPTLDLRQIAAQLSISLSTLYRAYANEPFSPAEQLRRARAETARARLSEQPDISIAELCRHSGFGSVSSLRRALRHHLAADHGTRYS